jgi:ABC-type polysaccharide/polyol phosphate transport system ATPase subunit
VIAIEVRGVSKNYPLNDSQWARFRRVFAPGAVRYEKGLWALRDIAFTVEKGEAFGVVGANGSGKSTLLQIVAGILRPTSGSVEVDGRLCALLELGSGFAPEFTGRQNVFLNASILGLTQAEIEARFETIERFAAIGDFIDQPIRTYSTGMVLRLAFAVAAHVDPEILIVDEALAVGDIAFRQRCMRRIHELRARGTTILFVSHDTGDVKALCERCLWLENGAVRALGEADDVVAGYLSAMISRESDRESKARVQRIAARPAETVCAVSGSHRYGNGNVAITGADVVTSAGDPVRTWAARQSVVLRVSFEVRAQVPSPIAGFLIRNAKGETIFGSNTARENYPLPVMEAGDVHTVEFHWVMPELAAGQYFVSIAVSEGSLEHFEVCDYVEDAIALTAMDESGQVRGYLHLPCSGVSVYRT